ncbi:MAG: hypothetical protein R3B97_07000 [Dehalococcoidia bacterium]
MRKLLVLGAAMVAILSLATIAQGEEHESSHIWFFGECENQYDSPYYDSSVTGASFLGGGCRGIGIFSGKWDKESIAEEVSYEAMEEFGGYWEVDYLKAINIFGGESQPGVDYGCEGSNPNSVQINTGFGGLWIAIFSVVPCEPEVCVPPVETLLAVAYVDNNVNDGPYDPCIDTLIAKLVDVDQSGTVNDGDKVETYQYPLDFDASTRGDFGVTEHTLSSVVVFSETSTSIQIEFGGNRFRFDGFPGDFEFYQEDDDDSTYTYIIDSVGLSPDDILIDAATASQPQTPQALASQLDPTDNAFIDVEIYVIDVCSADITVAC